MKVRAIATIFAAQIVCAVAHASECEVSLPEARDLSGSELIPTNGFVWVGSPILAAQVPENGHWIGMGPEHHFGDKWWWWREGYNAHDEPKPELIISGSRLDGQAPAIHIANATNAMGAEAVHVGTEFWLEWSSQQKAVGRSLLPTMRMNLGLFSKLGVNYHVYA